MAITTVLIRSLTHACIALGLPTDTAPTIEPSTHPMHGDYTCAIALQAFPTVDTTMWSSPRVLAQAIVDKLQEDTTSSSSFSISIAGPGFINFTLSDAALLTALPEVSAITATGEGKQVIVEYSSPNIAKPFTIGHLRSTIIGDAIANLFEATGWTVHRDNHLGDWGTQFGKLITALQHWGDLAQIEQSPAPVKELVALYVRFHTEAELHPELNEEARSWFAKLEQQDPEARDLWQRCVDWSWIEFDRIYSELGITFTEHGGRGYGESFFEDKMGVVLEELESVPQYYKTGEDGARLFFFPNDTLPPLMILKKDGSTLYATRDLATDKYRLNNPRYGKDVVIINEVGAEQELYFRQLFEVERLLGWVNPGQRLHVKHGHFRFKDQKMSTRKGNVIRLADVLEEAKRRARALASQKNPTDIAPSTEAVAIGALKWNDLKRSSHHDVLFDWDEILAMQGNSGPYIQYTAVRCRSVLAKAASDLPPTDAPWDPSERLVARQLLYFDDTVQRAAAMTAPHLLCTYLYELAQIFNSFYGNTSILNWGEETAQRVRLTQAVLAVLEKGSALLGLTIPDSM